MPADGPIEPLPGDLTLSVRADVVFRLGADPGWIVHIELQASPDATLPLRLLRYGAVLALRYGESVHSFVVVLRPEAGAGLTGELVWRLPQVGETLRYRYTVIHVHATPVATFLHGGPALLPLAPVSDLQGRPMTDVLGALSDEVDKLGPVPMARDVWHATRVMMNLRFSPAQTEHWLREVMRMRESTTLWAMLEEGRIEEARARPCSTWAPTISARRTKPRALRSRLLPT